MFLECRFTNEKNGCALIRTINIQELNRLLTLTGDNSVSLQIRFVGHQDGSAGTSYVCHVHWLEKKTTTKNVFIISPYYSTPFAIYALCYKVN